MKVSTKDVAAIMWGTFPGYRRKQVSINTRGSVTFHDLNWSGGTRCEYRACTLSGQWTGGMDRYNAMAPWDVRQAEGVSLDIPPGHCVVQAGFFCGKPSLATIYVNPADMAKFLPLAQGE